MAKTPGVGYTLKIHGVGYTPRGPAIWEKTGAENQPKQDRTFPINFSVRPWGPDGGVPADRGVRDYTLFAARYSGGDPTVRQGRHLVGNENERWHLNQRALRAAFQAGRLGNPADYTGEPTSEECYDLAATTPRGTGLYMLIPDESGEEPNPPKNEPGPRPNPDEPSEPSKPIDPAPTVPDPTPDHRDIRLAELATLVDQLKESLRSLSSGDDVQGTVDLIKSWTATGDVTIGKGRIARMKRLARYVDKVDKVISETVGQ